MMMLQVFVVSMLTMTVVGRDLRIGAFNVQVFGVTKASKPEVMNILVKIVRRYDLLLIQEIRDSTDTAIYDLLNRVNQGLSEPFSMALSPRLGRTTSKEQYAFFYRPSTGLQIKTQYVYNDIYVTGNLTLDYFEREPYIVAFNSNKTDLSEFALAGIHVAPEKAVDEINGLYAVFYDIKDKLNIGNIMVMGDLNADCNYVSTTKWAEIPLKLDPAYKWWIGDEIDTTTTATNCAYDRFISTGAGWESGIVPGSAVVYKFDQDSSMGTINSTLTQDVSDHYPIEFLLKEKRFVITQIADVYVQLYSATGGLTLNEFYPVRNGIYVYDASNQLQGEIRNVTTAEIQLRKALLEIVLHQTQTNAVDVKIFVEPTKNRWSGRQKSNLYISMPATNVQFLSAVQNILNLNGVCGFFTCATL